MSLGRPAAWISVVALGALAWFAWAGEGKPDDRLQRARSALEKAVEADPANSELWMHLGLVEHKLGNLDGAEKAFTKVAGIEPDRADAHYMLALIYEKRGEKARAVGAWEACLRVAADPNLKAIAEKHLKQLRESKD